MGGLLVLAPLDGLQNHSLRYCSARLDAHHIANTFSFGTAETEWFEPLRNNEKRNTGLMTYVPFLAYPNNFEPYINKSLFVETQSILFYLIIFSITSSFDIRTFLGLTPSGSLTIPISIILSIS